MRVVSRRPHGIEGIWRWGAVPVQELGSQRRDRQSVTQFGVFVLAGLIVFSIGWLGVAFTHTSTGGTLTGGSEPNPVFGLFKHEPMPYVAYLECLERLLLGASENVTMDASTWSNLRGQLQPLDVIPLLACPVMYDVQYFKEMICSLTEVGARYVVLIQNAEFGPLNQMMDEVEQHFARFGEEVRSRLAIYRHPENLGFSGAVNTGLRFGLHKTFHQVPWYVIANADVVFGPGLAKRMTRVANTLTLRDARRVQQLEREVLTEPNEFTPSWRAIRKLRPRTPLEHIAGGAIFGPDVDEVVSASYLLPDRVRYAAPEVQIREFQQHHCFVYPAERGMHVFVMTRLCALTAGLFDENFYPAYFEDIDYRWRAWALGFKETCVAGGGLTHITNANLKVIVAGGGQYYKSQLARRGNYPLTKWGHRFGDNALDHRRPASNYAHPFNVVEMPLDVWVMDATIPVCTRTGVGVRRAAHGMVCLYNTFVMREAGVIPANVSLVQYNFAADWY